MGCPPVRGDNHRALASGSSYVQVDKHGLTNLYHLYKCRSCTSRDIHAKVGKDGINVFLAKYSYVAILCAIFILGNFMLQVFCLVFYHD